jgi:hypothetical protein
MRASDATAPDHRMLHGRELAAHYRLHFPASTLPFITNWLLIAGGVTLLAGLSVQFSH